MDPFIGQIIMFGGTFAPQGWAFCNGQLLPISGNDALFSLLGTIYGGDGITTFALPDMRSRVPVHFGQGPGLSNYSQGSRFGQETVTLTLDQMANHTHTTITTITGDYEFACNTESGTSNMPTGNYLAAPSDGRLLYANEAGANVLMAEKPFDIDTDFQTTPVGNNGDHSNIQPYQVVNFIIAMVGIYPSRS